MTCTHRAPATTRAWDLRPGDVFSGRRIVDVRGIVGLASSPVMVIAFAADDQEHPREARIAAAHCESTQYYDDVMRGARSWVRSHGLHEGEPVDLDRLRAEVLSGGGSTGGHGSGGCACCPGDRG